MPQGPGTQPPLTPFKDPLPLPPLLRPEQKANGRASLSVGLAAQLSALHSELPPTTFWGYDGCVPGPTIEVRRGSSCGWNT